VKPRAERNWLNESDQMIRMIVQPTSDQLQVALKISIAAPIRLTKPRKLLKRPGTHPANFQPVKTLATLDAGCAYFYSGSGKPGSDVGRSIIGKCT
jgi:hypothetical protein